MPNTRVVTRDPWGLNSYVRFRHYDANGGLKKEWFEHNNRTRMGALWEMNSLYGTVADGTVFTIGLTGTIYEPEAEQPIVALIGEIGTFGFSRVAAARQAYVAPTQINGTYTIDLYKQFQHTGTGTSVGIGMAALFNKTANGTIYALATFTEGPATLTLAELLDVTWTISH
jgi:hypothetical protein